ncbi:unnamed protein product [Rhodiola kirilowii]
MMMFDVMLQSDCAFTPVDSYLTACGSLQNVTFEGRTFVPDTVQSSVLMKGNSVVARAGSGNDVPLPIHQSARVFPQTASYRFRIRQRGQHWIRLYFHPIRGSSQNLTSASITVVTNEFVLLENFTFENYNGSYLFKEYAVNVTDDTLTLTFIPSNNSVAFINAVEVMSIPDEVIPDQATELTPKDAFSLSEHALETVYRLNMGGPVLTPVNDTQGRTWENDARYLHVNSSGANVSVSPSVIRYKTVTPEIAPNLVYATAETMGDSDVPNENFNITWVFTVDPNFKYFVRVHFCDIISKLLNDLVFTLYINSDVALGIVDLSAWTGGLAVPLYRDFVANSTAQTDILTVSIGPEMQADFNNAIMNGLEIMKISNDARSLGGLRSVDGVFLVSPLRRKKIWIILGSAFGASVLAATLVLCYCCLAARKSKTPRQGRPFLHLPLYGNSLSMSKMSTVSQKSGGTASCISLASSNLGRVFLFQEIMDATNRFDESLLLGVGGFGRVYKGTLEDGIRVAVKRGNPRSEQGLAEFRTEIEMLSKLRHRHLVSLIGYCDERSEMILVYEYMANGPLRSHLYGTDLPSLPWKQRLEICIGAARGLHYLHTGASQSIIHRDVKTTNILLDENFVAKVADFGLSKAGPSIDQTHVSTAVKGSFGYLDPEYFRRQQLTEKSDVYSFGVVLMEVICARPALNPVLPREQVNIAEWAMVWQKKGMLDQIMDQFLRAKVNPASLKKFGDTAEKCLAEYGVDRPSMGDVLWNLEYALQLEESSEALMEPEDNSTNHIPSIPLTPYDTSMSMINNRNSGSDEGAEDAATSVVFSQLVNPRGR